MLSVVSVLSLIKQNSIFIELILREPIRSEVYWILKRQGLYARLIPLTYIQNSKSMYLYQTEIPVSSTTMDQREVYHRNEATFTPILKMVMKIRLCMVALQSLTWLMKKLSQSSHQCVPGSKNKHQCV